MKIVMLAALLFLMISSVFGLGSYTDSGAVPLDTVAPELQLISPNGGEIWYIGDTRDITWTASDPNLNPNSVNLWYSLNGGNDYTSIAQDITNTESYAWQLPSVQCYNAKVRLALSDSYGNQGMKSSAGAFSIAYVPPAAPEGVSVNSANQNAVITWNAVTQTIPPYNSPITPDGYIVLYNETPYEDDLYYYFLAATDQLSYTHQRVTEFRSQMFYKVVAYKNYSRSESAALSALLQSRREQPILWRDALELIHRGGEQ